MTRFPVFPQRVATIACLLGLPTEAAAQGPVNPADYAPLQFRNIGPTRGGRVTTVTGVPGQPGVFYFGATGGGVWKTTDYGQLWTPISDGFFETGSIGAIRVAPSSPNVVWVGTGSDGIRSNVILGRGVYRSEDAGKTWTHAGLREVGQIGAVEIHPTDPRMAFVAAIGNPFRPTGDRGVYRTRDAGATWTRVLFLSDSTGAVDLEFAPDNPNTVYAAMWRGERKPWTIISGANEGGIYRSTDAGANWTKLGGGLPTGLWGKADLAVSAADPNRLYVLVEALPGAGLYRSDDRGTTFRLVSSEPQTLRRPFYYLNVDADPTNADVVFSNSEAFQRSSDGGATWQTIRTPHGDNHDIWVDPADPMVWVQSNDGGANVTRDGGATWSTQHNQPTAELYQVAVDDRFPYWVYAGQQDNTTIAVPSLPPYDAIGGQTSYWRDIGGCETGPAVPKPGDPDIVYSNCKGQFGRFSVRTGQEKHYWVGAQYLYGANPKDLKYRFQRVSPIHVSPHDPNTVYHASQFVHRTRDEGVTWETISPDLTAFEADKQVISGTPITRDVTGEEHYSTLYAVRESPIEKGVIWAGANDGPVHVTRDDGKTWQKVTPADLPPGGRVQNIEPSPHQAGKAYLAVYRYLLGDFRPYAYRTTDYGRSWTRITDGTNGIPADYPTRVVREDPDREGLLYAGTEFGLFISFDDGGTWQPFQQNLPVTPVTDIAVYRQDLVLSTMGRSYWILNNLTLLHQLGSAPPSAHHLYRPQAAIRMRYQVSRAAPDSVEYPAPGATIDYTLASDVDGAKLDILDGRGEVVRRFGSRGTPGRSGGLASKAGTHRFRWDLRTDGDPRGGRGPLATPGQYTVRLSIGSWTATTPLEVLLDPRVAADGVTTADLVEQAAMIQKVSTLQADARAVLERARGMTRENDRDMASIAEARAIVEDMTSGPGAYPVPKLVEHIGYLAGLLDRADQKIGRDAHERYAELVAELAAVENRARSIRGWTP